MKRIRFAIVFTVITLSLLFAYSKPLFAQSQANKPEETATRTNESQKSARQSPKTHVMVLQTQESTASVLKAARIKGSEIVAIIEFPSTMLPWVVDTPLGVGQIVAVYIRSLTTEWNGVTYATTAAPITGLPQAIEQFSLNHRLANPEDHQSLFGIDAFAVKTTAESLDQWLALFPNAQLAYARELSSEAVAQFRARRASGIVDVYIPRQSDAKQKLDSASRLSQTSPQAASSPFLPTTATLNIDAPSLDKRMISGSFSWSSDDALAGLKTLFSTLEIQTHFLSHSTDPSQKTTYVGDKLDFAASWAYAYYDTQALDDLGQQGDPQERDYTVGAWDSSRAFKANTTYNFWIATRPGLLSANMVKFSAQKGTYLPNPLPLVCDVNPSLCVWPILGGTGFFSPLMPNGPEAETRFSIVAPTVLPFTYPTPICNIPPGQPELSTTLKKIPASDAKILGNQMSAVQKAFTDGGKKSGLGCATTRLHEDKLWWPRGGKTQDFAGSQTGKGTGAIMLAPGASQAFWVHGAIWARYASLQPAGPQSVVGEPTGDEQSVTSSRGSNGAYQGFTRGWLYFNGRKNQTYYVVNAIAQKYRSVGLHIDPLGFPTSDEYAWNGGARNDFEGGYIYWTASTGAVIVRNTVTTAPTITQYAWSTTPFANQPFGGTIIGTSLVSGMEVWFCAYGSSTSCFQHPPVGVTVNSPTSLNVSNVRLGAGAWQFYLKTSAGQSLRSTTFIVQGVGPTISQYVWNPAPKANEPFGGTITGTKFVSGGTQVWFCRYGSSTSCFQHPTAGVTVSSPTSLSVINVRLGSGPWQVYLKTSAGESSRSTPFTVQASTGAVPTITGYSWSTPPKANQPFGGTITGTNLVAGSTQVWFCVNGSSLCYQHPAAGVSVNSPTSLTISNVKLSGGAWQIYLKTSVGQSARSTAFNVQTTGPTIANYSWSTTPNANQPFNGVITGTGFVSGGTQVWFCVNGTSTCYQHPLAGVTVNSATSLSVSNARLGGGLWQIYLQTAAGQSARSTPFTVQVAAALPTINGYSWNTTPRANQPFGGTITGTGFVVSGTQVWFCVNGTSTCYQQPAAGVTVNNATNLSVSNVNLGSGQWQFYVQSPAGQSARSTAFTVQPIAPTLTGYSWNSTPRANQLFSGMITGTGFVSGGTQVWFCVNGSSACYQQPAAGVSVSSSNSLSVINVNLGSGSWQIYVQTSAGQSARSATFTVQEAGPTINGYSWNMTPRANQSFSGFISGSGFIYGGTQVWFCISGTSTCYQQPAAGVSVNNSTSLNVSNVNLSSGSWQFYVQTSAGQSSRSNSFTVQAAGPTINGYSWNTTPIANQPFSGTVTGAWFISGGTQVWFCISGTSTCYQQPAAGVNVNNSTSLSVINVRLSSGSWQFYVRTDAGQSARSTTFTVW